MVVEGDMAVLENQTNLLNLLPLPEVRKSKVPMYVGAAVAALFLVAGVAYFGFVNPVFNSSESAEDTSNSEVLSESNQNTPAQPKETPQSTPSETNETEEEVELNREDLSVRIENGAGIPGIAGSTQTTLEELGYTVESIGNAEGDPRENTLVQFKDSAAQYRNLLLDDIKDDFEVVYEDGLSEDLSYDVLIVIGQN